MVVRRVRFCSSAAIDAPAIGPLLTRAVSMGLAAKRKQGLVLVAQIMLPQVVRIMYRKE